MFKQSFKYYKSKSPSPSLNEVLDLNKSTVLLESGKIKNIGNDLVQTEARFGLEKPEKWECYEIACHNGLIFIKNPFTCAGQRYWIKQCLKEYSKKPNKLNIDSFNIIPPDKDWWDFAQTENKVLKSLRWATLGYHHNWDTKVYSEDNKSELPENLKHMTEYIAQKLGFLNFVAEAAIVNYYHMDSTLSGHTDHSEQNLDAPLFSYSFGQNAIFLLGGETLDEKPTAMFLKSGDILIMSKESRLCYHGVPRIMRTESDIWNDDNEYHLNTEDYFALKDSSWRPFNNYINHSRININVRQVLNIGQFTLNF